MDRETFYQLMDKYIDGLLSNEEKEHFEYLLKIDKNKLEEFEKHKKIRRAVTIKSRQEKLAVIDRYKSEYLNDQIKPAARRIRLKHLSPYAVAASVLLIIGIVALLNNLTSKKEITVDEREFVNLENSKSSKNEFALDPMEADSLFSDQESLKLPARAKEMYKTIKNSPTDKVLYDSVFITTGNENIVLPKFNKKEIGITIFYHPTIRKYELTDTSIAIFLNEDIEIKSFDLINIEEDQLELEVNNKRVVVRN